jgi:hypothetical protein
MATSSAAFAIVDRLPAINNAAAPETMSFRMFIPPRDMILGFCLDNETTKVSPQPFYFPNFFG